MDVYKLYLGTTMGLLCPEEKVGQNFRLIMEWEFHHGCIKSWDIIRIMFNNAAHEPF